MPPHYFDEIKGENPRGVTGAAPETSCNMDENIY